MEWFSVLPLVVVLALLFRQQHMLVAGFAGGLLALIVAALFRDQLPVVQETVEGATQTVVLDLPRAFQRFNRTIPEMLSFTSPIVNAAAAFMVAGVGGFAALLELARRRMGGRVEFLAAFVVLLQAFATYTAGLGAGNTVITAPLIAAAVGASPGVMAGMALATAGAFTTSPSSAESALTSRLAGLDDVGPYVTAMRPFFLLAVLVGTIVAWWSVRRGQAAPAGPVAHAADTSVGQATDKTPQSSKVGPHTSTGRLWSTAAPALWLLAAVVLSRPLNNLLGSWGLPPIFSPLFYISVTVALVALLRLSSLNDTAQSLVDGGSFILVRLFAVGIFLAFINMIRDIGAFQVLANAALSVPAGIVVPVTALVGFLIAIPAGAYSVAVMALIGPVLGEAGFSPLQLGFVMMVIGMGTQISWVQINVASLSYGFNVSIPQVVRNNAPVVVPFAVLLAMLSLVFGR